MLSHTQEDKQDNGVSRKKRTKLAKKL